MPATGIADSAGKRRHNIIKFFFLVVVVVCAQINENVLTNNLSPAFSGSASSANGPAEGVHPLLHVVDASVTSPLAFVHAESLIILGSRLDDHVLVAGAESFIIFGS